MVTEEIGVNHVLRMPGVQVIETDLGEYILQLDQDPPSHVVVPAIHKESPSDPSSATRTSGL